MTGLARYLPIAEWLPRYRAEWLRSDVVAGVSVAAVALPIGIAYAQLAGFPPVVGIYSCILPPVAYALFGSSRQLIVNPDSAACAIVAATVAPLAMGDPARYGDLSVALAVFTGLLCIAGGFLRLGAIADLLSRPILTGYLNGIALSIIVGQLATLLGVTVPSGGFFRTLGHVVARLGETHLATLAMGAGLLVLLRLLHLLPKVPGPLIAAVLGAGLVYALDLGRAGVAIVGDVPSGFPRPRIPAIAAAELPQLVAGAAGIALVSFCSMMTTARGFAARNGYSIDTNRDLVALGVCDLASALNRGFVVSGADSRTAVADASGGKTPVTSLIAALAMALVLLFLTAPLGFVPRSALAAILISSAFGLFDFPSLRRYYRVSRPEFVLSVVAMLGVMTIGVLQGIGLAVGLALLRLLVHAARPHDAVLGLLEKDGEIHAAPLAEGGRAVPGLIIYRFDASIVFFNADHFRSRVRALVSGVTPAPTRFLLDAEAITLVDVTGAETLAELDEELSARGIALAIARANGEVRLMLERSGVADRLGARCQFSTVRAGAHALAPELRSPGPG